MLLFFILCLYLQKIFPSIDQCCILVGLLKPYRIFLFVLPNYSFFIIFFFVILKIICVLFNSKKAFLLSLFYTAFEQKENKRTTLMHTLFTIQMNNVKNVNKYKVFIAKAYLQTCYVSLRKTRKDTVISCLSDLEKKIP